MRQTAGWPKVHDPKARWAVVSGPVLLAAVLLGLLGFPASGLVSSSLRQLGSRPAAAAPTWGAPSVRVAGNRLVNASGHPIRLLGVDRSGTEYACVQGWGIFDGPSGPASIRAMKAWHIGAVRIPLNEDCWLGLNGVKPKFSGIAYRRAIETYVRSLNEAGLVAILDLHWSAPGREQATGQQVMADASHSVAFWYSVAHLFRLDDGVVFDLYNEPHGISWNCWRNGCTTAAGWRTAGMQQMLDAVRRAGSRSPVMLGGLAWAGDLAGFLRHAPRDPLHQVIASVHLYNFSTCHTSTCWNRTIAPVARTVPVVTGEIGENDCRSGFIDRYMSWADRHRISYLAWAWDTWNCSSGPALITSYEGTPTAYGRGFRSHLEQLAAG